MFQLKQAVGLSIFGHVALDLESKIEGTTGSCEISGYEEET